jgi:kynurenine formamidase
VSGRQLDLTQPFFHNGAYNPDLPLPSVELARTVVSDGFKLEQLSLCTHVGTHMDAPCHVFEEGGSVDQYPLERLHGVGIPVDAQLGDEEPIGAALLEPYHDRLTAGTIALLRTGWGDDRGHTERYVNRSPWLDASGADWLAKRDVAGVVIDHFSIAGRGPAEKTQPAHTILLGNGIWIVEEARLPAELFERPSWYVIALPMRLLDGSGAPTRVIALEHGPAAA